MGRGCTKETPSDKGGLIQISCYATVQRKFKIECFRSLNLAHYKNIEFVFRSEPYKVERHSGYMSV